MGTNLGVPPVIRNVWDVPGAAARGEGGKGICSHFLVLWIQGRFRSWCGWSWELPAHSSRIAPQHPPRAAGKAGMQRIPSHQGELSPGMGNICQAGKNPWLGVSARAEEGRESRLGSPEQEKPRSWGGTCTPVCSSWIWGREGKLGIMNGSGRGAGLCDKRGEMSPSVCLALLSPLPLACAALRVPLTH